ncbi:hypothetical protein Tco_0521055 [Tanacetum coccineum]
MLLHERHDLAEGKKFKANMALLDSQFLTMILVLNVTTYKRGLSILEGQSSKYKEHEVLFSKEIALLKRSVGHKEYHMGLLREELEKVKLEKEGFEFKIAKFEKLAKDLDQLLPNDEEEVGPIPEDAQGTRTQASHSPIFLTSKDFDGGYVTFGGGGALWRQNISKRSTFAEAVSTACYVQNRVLIVKPHNKTPYELFRGIQGVSESSTSSQQDQDNQDCIVMPIWKDASYFDDASPRSVADAQIQDQNGLHDEIDDSEKTHDDSSLQNNGTADQQVNTARPEVNTGSREVSTVVPEVNTATPEVLWDKVLTLKRHTKLEDPKN